MYIEKLKQIVIGSDVLINNFLYIVIHHHQRGIRRGQNPSGAATSHADCGTGKPGQD